MTELHDVPSYDETYIGFPVWITDTASFPSIWQRDRFYRINCRRFNAQDYSNILFIRADRLKANDLAAYWQCIAKPRDAMDRWLNARSYTDADYWRDIVGTHLLRERRFAEAEEWLSKISPDYQHRLNTEPWMDLDPFSHEVKRLENNENFKLLFARRMAEQERLANNPASDPNDRADALLTLSIGLRNAFSDICWPLVAYGYGGFYLWDEEIQYYDHPLHNGSYYRPYMFADDAVSPYVEPVERLSSELRKKAFATYTNPDRKAQALRRVHEYTYLMKHYAGTPTGQDIARHCDRWKDYLVSKPTELS